MDRQESINRFQLDDNLTRHDQIDPIRCRQRRLLVADRNRPLRLESDVSRRQLELETRQVRRLEQAGPKVTMHFNRSSDDVVGHLIEYGVDQHAPA